jgi:hypothetical protein
MSLERAMDDLSLMDEVYATPCTND